MEVRVRAVLPPPELAEACAALLDEDERERAQRLASTNPAGRARFVTGRATLRALAADHLGCRPDAVPIGHEAGGRLVTTKGPCVSVSHSGDLVAVVLARACVGIDVERVRPVRHAERLARRLLPPDSRDPEGFLAAWTRLEATAKARGHGVRPLAVWPDDLEHADLDLPDGYVGTLVHGPC